VCVRVCVCVCGVGVCACVYTVGGVIGMRLRGGAVAAWVGQSGWIHNSNRARRWVGSMGQDTGRQLAYHAER